MKRLILYETLGVATLLALAAYGSFHDGFVLAGIICAGGSVGALAIYRKALRWTW